MRPTQLFKREKGIVETPGAGSRATPHSLAGHLGRSEGSGRHPAPRPTTGGSSPPQQRPGPEGGDLLGAKDRSSTQEAATQTSGFRSSSVLGAFGRRGFPGARSPNVTSPVRYVVL